MEKKIIAVDIGGTTVKGAVFSKNKIQKKVVKNTSRVDPLNTTIKIIEQLMENDKEISAIGIATAGRVNSTTGEILYATPNLENWMGRNIKQELETLFGIPTYVINDAKAATLAEAFTRKVRSLVFLTIGTGLGGGVFIDGKLVNGTLWEAGEIGHTILYPNGRKCNCGKRGCAEQYISMKVLHRYAKIPLAERNQLLAGFINNEEKVLAAVEKLCGNLAMLIDKIFLIIDPEIVVVGGGFSELGEMALHILRNKLIEYSSKSLYHPTQVELSIFQNDAGLIGASLFAATQYEEVVYHG
ncbi:ROK family protein [Fervidobacterium islandicum]|uniref:ROK family protein n=1 Tax=Fervidobacterium islandicum TaxID=2423 RepID=A0AAI8GCV6_FERIS|nr:ROK family protein [Fervidobacterium islandicum]AMW32708.1 ROK family protein [Fervidobacterium islandicum]